MNKSCDALLTSVAAFAYDRPKKESVKTVPNTCRCLTEAESGRTGGRSVMGVEGAGLFCGVCVTDGDMWLTRTGVTELRVSREHETTRLRTRLLDLLGHRCHAE